MGIGVQKVQTRQVAKYILLPELFPRLRELFTTGFAHLAFLVASVYGMVRILPPGHPYLNPSNIGKFGIRHAIAQAANHIVFRKENIDQILIFSASIVAFILLAVQFAMLGFTLIVHKAFAADFMGFFITVHPEKDIAFEILARVFGVPDLFCNSSGSCVDINDQLPWPFHKALQGLYQYYSLAILLFAVLIFLYYVMVVTAETAQSGTPFGKRFNQVWAPLRLVAAIGLLVPVNWGLNSGQYITLYAAKYGSGLATHGWLLFNRALSDSMTRAQPTGEPTENLVALPNAPDVSSLLSFMILVQTCRAGYEKMYFYDDTGILGGGIQPWLVKLGGSGLGMSVQPAVDFDSAVDFYEGGDVMIRFGRYDEERYTNDKGNSFPFCGEIAVRLHDSNHQPGAWQMQSRYFDLILAMWDDPELIAYGKRMSEIYSLNQDRDPCSANVGVGDNPDCGRPPLAQWRQNLINNYQAILENYVKSAWEELRDTGEFGIPQEMLERGWGGAGIWYNRIAQFNGAFMSAVRDVPMPTLYPSVLQNVLDERRKQDQNIAGFRGLCPNQADGQKYKPVNDERDGHMALMMCETIDQQLKEDVNQSSSDASNTGNAAWKMMNMLFDAYGLSDLRKPENQHVHPLAQLVMIGKSIVDSTIRNLAISFFAAAGGGLSQYFDKDMGAAMKALSKMFFSLAMIGLVAGFILYYVLPFLPFIYFFFAVGSWVKTIFEAMVGVPLWALAHLRIDGEGLPGQQAAEGYFLIFEIFIRPILCVFGLLAGVAIFAAQARVLNAIFDLVIENLTGFNDMDTARVGPFMPLSDSLSFKRQVVDQFFFTIIYATLLYMMAIASFKLIDLVPKGILRWIGSGARTFQDNREDPTSGLVQHAAMGGQMIGQQVASTMRQGFELGGSVAGEILGPDRSGAQGMQAARAAERSGADSAAGTGGTGGATTAGGLTGAAPPATAPSSTSGSSGGSGGTGGGTGGSSGGGTGTGAGGSTGGGGTGGGTRGGTGGGGTGGGTGGSSGGGTGGGGTGGGTGGGAGGSSGGGRTK